MTIYTPHWIALGGWILGWILLWRVPRLPRNAPEGPMGPVTIIIPARNEARRLPGLLGPLTDGLPMEAQVIVVNDHSTDGTREVASRYPRVRVLSAPDLPAGWTGKQWACHTGAQAAPAGNLVFLDADVELRPGALSRALAMRRERGGLISVWPYHRVVRPYEHLSALFNVTTFMAIGAGSLFPPQNLREAAGPMIVTTTADYARAGGHAAVRGDVVEDLRLGRLYAELGLPVAVLGGGDDVIFRMYGEGLFSLVRGCLRNLGRGAFVLSPVRILAIAVWITCAYGAFLWAGGLSHWPGIGLTAMFAVQMGVLFRRMGSFGWVDAALYPVHLLFFTLVFVLGIFRVRVSRRVHWRGRSVAMVDEAAPKQSPLDPGA
jgi:4,4'-diaponeurosporenoate glycosyltransferase